MRPELECEILRCNVEARARPHDCSKWVLNPYTKRCSLYISDKFRFCWLVPLSASCDFWPRGFTAHFFEILNPWPCWVSRGPNTWSVSVGSCGARRKTNDPWLWSLDLVEISWLPTCGLGWMLLNFTGCRDKCLEGWGLILKTGSWHMWKRGYDWNQGVLIVSL